MPKPATNTANTVSIHFDTDKKGHPRRTKDGLSYRFSVTFHWGEFSFRIPGWRINSELTKVSVPVNYYQGTQYLNVVTDPESLNAILGCVKDAFNHR